eukprot:gene15062-10776_t
MLVALMADSMVYAVMRCEDHLLGAVRNKFDDNRQRRVDELEKELLSAIVDS